MRFFIKTFFLATIIFSLFFSNFAKASQPVLEPSVNSSYAESSSLLVRSILIQDPTIASQAVYGNLSNTKSLDAYAFIPSKDATIPIELLVPARERNLEFKPQLIVISKEMPEGASTDASQLPLPLTDGRSFIKLDFPGELNSVVEPYTVEKLWHGPKLTLDVKAKTNYFILIIEPNSKIGDYVLSVGDVQSFSNTSWKTLVSNWLNLKLGIVGDISVSWKDFLGLLIALIGLVLGFGSSIIADIQGWLARKSEYWTESYRRTHKVTRITGFIGLDLFVLGSIILYRVSGIGGVAMFQIILSLLLFANMIFILIWVSPKLLNKSDSSDLSNASELVGSLPQKLQNILTISFFVSVVGWWGNLFFLVWYLVVLR